MYATIHSKLRLKDPRTLVKILPVLGVIGAAIWLHGPFHATYASGPPAPMPIISQGKPIYASSEAYAVTNANDANYNTFWRSNGPAWVALDLSSVPTAQRGMVDFVWYGTCCSYDNSISGTGAYNLPGSYTIQVNAAAGGGSAPSSGWVTLASVSNSTYHSRQHVVNMTGYNWIRMNITAIDGSIDNMDAAMELEVRNASAGTDDDWIFYGDSITEGGMGQQYSGSVPSYSQLINGQVPTNFPLEEGGGIGYQTAGSALTYIDAQLAIFPGKYVGLSYGTNDAGCGNATCLSDFYNNYVQLVQKVLALGKIPMVPTVPWGCTGNLTANVPNYNQKIQLLYTNFPQIVHGPDLYTYFNTHQSLISSDCIHPSGDGMDAYRQQWANTMLATIYSGTSDTTNPTVSMSAPSNGATVSGASVTVSANASDNIGVAGVQFKLDGNNLQTEDTTSPYSIIWDSTSVSNGSHSLTAIARDAAGNTTTSSVVTVTVSNACSSGDVNGDCHVTITDLSILLSNWNSTTNAACDLNHNGVVDILDLSILLSNYGR
jgi:hypothetical protein